MVLGSYMFKLRIQAVDAVYEVPNAHFHNTSVHHVISFHVLKSVINVRFQVLQIVQLASENLVFHNTPEVKIHQDEVGGMCKPIFSFVLLRCHPKYSLPHSLCHKLHSLVNVFHVFATAYVPILCDTSVNRYNAQCECNFLSMRIRSASRYNNHLAIN